MKSGSRDDFFGRMAICRRREAYAFSNIYSQVTQQVSVCNFIGKEEYYEYYQKVVSMMLAIAMLMAIMTTVFAASEQPSDEEFWLDDEQYGTYYAYITDEEAIIALYDKDEHTMEIYYRDKVEDEYTIYVWDISYDPLFLTPTMKSFWTDAIDSVRDTRGADRTIELIPPTDEKETPARSSANADMYNDLVSILGTAPYNNMLKYTSLVTMETIQIYEDLEFVYTSAGSSAGWLGGTVLSVVISIIGNFTPTPTWLNFFGTLFNVAALANSAVSAGNVKKYTPKAIYTRHSSVNGSAYWYTQTTKRLTYKAYEDNTANGLGRTMVSPESPSTYYSGTSAFFNSYSAQEAEAYRIFQDIGQMP